MKHGSFFDPISVTVSCLAAIAVFFTTLAFASYRTATESMTFIMTSFTGFIDPRVRSVAA